MVKSGASLLAVAASTAILGSSLVAAQGSESCVDGGSTSPQRCNLTPDGFWHNRYHSILSMAAYGDYNTLCPNQTFTQATLDKNFPNSTFPPWEVIEEWGPTPSGCQGFSARVPEMNKMVMVFRGDLYREQNLPTAVVNWTYIPGLDNCEGCTMNEFAAQGYLECSAETNNWNKTREAYEGQGLVFSITGHGLGGMHSLIASVDLNHQNTCYYSHALGTPRTFNLAGANHYNWNFNGEAGERGIFNGDTTGEIIPESDDYVHAGTAFYYYGWDVSTGQPNWELCWGGDGFANQSADPLCQPNSEGVASSTQDHYYYFTNVGDCGGTAMQDLDLINRYLLFNVNSTEPYVFDEPKSVSNIYANVYYQEAQTTPVNQQPQPFPPGPAATSTSTQYYLQDPTTTTTYYEAAPTTAQYVAQTTSADDEPITATRHHHKGSTSSAAAPGQPGP